ncbi:hypothetical protein AURDEDRAFT_155002, partial [Auricularia subglabra TFB-10046 SS5]
MPPRPVTRIRILRVSDLRQSILHDLLLDTMRCMVKVSIAECTLDIPRRSLLSLWARGPESCTIRLQRQLPNEQHARPACAGPGALCPPASARSPADARARLAAAAAPAAPHARQEAGLRAAAQAGAGAALRAAAPAPAVHLCARAPCAAPGRSEHSACPAGPGTQPTGICCQLAVHLRAHPASPGPQHRRSSRPASASAARPSSGSRRAHRFPLLARPLRGPRRDGGQREGAHVGRARRAHL